MSLDLHATKGFAFVRSKQNDRGRATRFYQRGDAFKRVREVAGPFRMRLGNSKDSPTASFRAVVVEYANRPAQGAGWVWVARNKSPEDKRKY